MTKHALHSYIHGRIEEQIVYKEDDALWDKSNLASHIRDEILDKVWERVDVLETPILDGLREQL